MHKTRIVVLDDAQAVIISRGLVYDHFRLRRNLGYIHTNTLL